MPIQVGVMCENCGTVYLTAHPDSIKRINRNVGSSKAPGMYTLACLCGTIRSFHKTEMKAYSVSKSDCERGAAKRGDYREQPPISYRNKL